jgi:hypothetical protein
MRSIAEYNMLLRAQIELPSGLKLATEEFREGWNFVRSGGASRLERKIGRHGWHFIRISGESLQSGVGETSQQAIARALKLALRSLSEHFNALEVGRIYLTTYPWFCLARVEIHPYRIQKAAVQSIPDDALPLPGRARKKRGPVSVPWLAAESGCTMPALREMLIQSRGQEAGPR